MSESDIREKLYWKLPEIRSVIGIEWYRTCDALLPMPMDEARERACSALGSYIGSVLRGNRFAHYSYGLSTAEETAQDLRQAKFKRRLEATSQGHGHASPRIRSQEQESVLGFKTASPDAEFRFRSKMYEDLKKRMNAIGSRIAFLIASRSHLSEAENLR
jgi:hypothetical protein